ncbi:exonuclease-like protein [Sporormia fimetaria CBS 119925]|uniref:Exonuclease-like protein n=1 Tax=Sporormia fimetaria CBS 119925 TaxID=1340428 RepID=A0A6A6UZG4_9PLEO|nr:exonuclease-like protein [Sporormia fimetaria CBS 119925]
MGISGLLPLLKSIQNPCNLRKFAGLTIGVDAYGWLHRGTAACAIELALDKPTTKYVEFAMNRVRMLVHFGITPYLVFDGDYLPSKAETEKERAKKRRESKQLGLELLKLGKTAQAHSELQKAVDVTPEMARRLIEELKHHNIPYVVAPYEADPQLAYLEREGIISGILSEDSDLLVFGARCLITKLDKYGECVEIRRDQFTACREISLVGWSDADFRRMAMLSGCDYLPGIGKMGLKTAYRMLRKHKTVDRVIRAAQFEAQYKVPRAYAEAFADAERTFLHQWVFCPVSQKLINLTPLEHGADLSAMPYIGQRFSDDIAIGIANGNLNPHTKEAIIVQAVDRSRVKPLRAASRPAPSQAPDLKGAKPIDSYFKPKRVPLAELDPNSFSMSPSQQVLLERHHQSPNVTTTLAPPVTHSPARPLPRPLSARSIRTAPQPSRRTISAPLSRASEPHPAKRQRLCSNNLFATPAQPSIKAEVERSRFFASTITEPSPSLRSAAQSRKNKKRDNDFELHSDDSFDAAMAELADLEELKARPGKKISIFKDDFKSSVSSESQSSVFSRSTMSESQLTRGTLTPATSYGSPELAAADTEETVFSSALSSKVKGFRSKFSYGASVGEASSSPTPLARVTEALTPPVIAAGQFSKTTKISVKFNDDTPDLDDKVWAEMEAGIVVAAVGDTEVLASPETQRVVKGGDLETEDDVLVPDSDVESVCSPRKTLNLGQFSFKGL